ncbi:MAG: hypothetical protein ABID04_00470 [Patescibacteria group bacterium]
MNASNKSVYQKKKKGLLSSTFDPIKEFIELGKRLPNMKKKTILRAIKKGRNK